MAIRPQMQYSLQTHTRHGSRDLKGQTKYLVITSVFVHDTIFQRGKDIVPRMFFQALLPKSKLGFESVGSEKTTSMCIWEEVGKQPTYVAHGHGSTLEWSLMVPLLLYHRNLAPLDRTFMAIFLTRSLGIWREFIEWQRIKSTTTTLGC